MKDFKDITVSENDFYLVFPLYNEFNDTKMNDELNEIYGSLYQDIKLELEKKGLKFENLRTLDKYKLSDNDAKAMLEKSTGIIIPKLNFKEDPYYQDLLKDYQKEIYVF